MLEFVCRRCCISSPVVAVSDRQTYWQIRLGEKVCASEVLTLAVALLNFFVQYSTREIEGVALLLFPRQPIQPEISL